MKTSKKKGISLIVLVITIIIMIILAAAVILSLSGSNVVEKANEAKTKTGKAALVESANMEYASWLLTDQSTDALVYVKQKLQDKFTTTELNQLEIRDGKITLIEPLVANSKVPPGCSYKQGATIYNPGDSIPEVATGDEFITADYTYKYNYYYSYRDYGLVINDSQNGWGVRVNDDSKSSYESIYTSIGNRNVTNMTSTFWICDNMTTAPVIPSTVSDMSNTFEQCTRLTTAPVIPSSVTNMIATFAGCTSLTTAPVIPSSVTNMNSTFCFCSALIGEVVINANPTYYNSCFGDTEQTIILSGTSSMLDDLARTATAEPINVTVSNT